MILVTGGSGLLGGAIVQELLSAGINGDEIIIIDNVIPKNPTGCCFIKHDICGPLVNFKPFDIVFHCAGLLGSETLFGNIVEAERVNVIGTLNILELQKNYGIVIQPGLLGDWLNPYMISKNTAERYGLMYRKEYGTKYITIRPTDIYGPGQSIAQKKITPTFIMAALKQEPLPIYGSGNQMVRMLFVKDVARLFVGVAKGRHPGNWWIYNLASQQPENYLSVKDYAEMIIDFCDSSSELEYLPMRPGQPVNAEDVYANIINNEFESVSLQDGLVETIEYYRALQP